MQCDAEECVEIGIRLVVSQGQFGHVILMHLYFRTQ